MRDPLRNALRCAVIACSAATVGCAGDAPEYITGAMAQADASADRLVAVTPRADAGAVAPDTAAPAPAPQPRPAEPPPAEPPPAEPPPAEPPPAEPPPPPGLGQACSGSCAGDALCVGGVCRRPCMLNAGAACNDVGGSVGCTAAEACVPVGNAAACVPATIVGEGKRCGPERPERACVPGTLCVAGPGLDPRCLPLCKYGCFIYEVCVQTDVGCPVCLSLL